MNFLRCFWLFLALLLFNISIDTPDLYGDQVKEDLSYNDIESVSELFFEIVLGLENFIPENEDDDTDERSNFSWNCDLHLSKEILVVEKHHTYSNTNKNKFTYKHCFIKNPYLTKETKPPQT